MPPPPALEPHVLDSEHETPGPAATELAGSAEPMEKKTASVEEDRRTRLFSGRACLCTSSLSSPSVVDGVSELPEPICDVAVEPRVSSADVDGAVVRREQKKQELRAKKAMLQAKIARKRSSMSAHVAVQEVGHAQMAAHKHFRDAFAKVVQESAEEAEYARVSVEEARQALLRLESFGNTRGDII